MATGRGSVVSQWPKPCLFLFPIKQWVVPVGRLVFEEFTLGSQRQFAVAVSAQSLTRQSRGRRSKRDCESPGP